MRAALLALLLLAACDQDMVEQPRYEEYEPAALFPDGKVNQTPPPGTVARGELVYQAALYEKPPMSAALLARGKERYEAFCVPCHGWLGDGDGIVVQRGFPSPPSYHIARLRQAPDDYVVKVITEGYGVMYSYAARVPPADRWAIAAYVRALQLSQLAPVAALPDDDRAKLDGATP